MLCHLLMLFDISSKARISIVHMCAYEHISTHMSKLHGELNDSANAYVFKSPHINCQRQLDGQNRKSENN